MIADLARVKSVIAFAATFVIWLVVGVYAICIGHYNIQRDGISTVLDWLNLHGLNATDIVTKLTKETQRLNIHKIVVMNALTQIVLIAYIQHLKYAKKVFIFIAFLGCCLALIRDIFLFLTLLLMKTGSFYYIAAILINLLGESLVVFYVSKVGFNNIAKIVDASARAIVFYPYSTLISILVLALDFGVTAFSFLVFLNLRTLEMGFAVSLVPHLINLVGGFWISCFIVDVGYVCLTTAFLTWNKADFKESLSRSDVHLISSLRFHAKTVCSASSISSLHYEGKALAKQGCEPMNIIKGLVFLIYTRWVTMACYTVAAIERADFYTSAKKVFETVLASPIKFVVMIIMGLSSATIGMVLVLSIEVLVASNLGLLEGEGLSLCMSCIASVAVPLSSITWVLWNAIVTMSVCHHYGNNGYNGHHTEALTMKM